ASRSPRSAMTLSRIAFISCSNASIWLRVRCLLMCVFSLEFELHVGARGAHAQLDHFVGLRRDLSRQQVLHGAARLLALARLADADAATVLGLESGALGFDEQRLRSRGGEQSFRSRGAHFDGGPVVAHHRRDTEVLARE